MEKKEPEIIQVAFHNVGIENELQFLNFIAKFWIFCAVCVFLIQRLNLITIAYGRYSSRKFGAPIPARIAWVVFESPALFTTLIILWTSECKALSNPLNIFLIAAFLAHYFNRSFIYPCLMSAGGKPFPFFLLLSAVCFCTVNGYMQARYHTAYSTFEPGEIYTPHAVIGLTLFVVGMAINFHSDSILRKLRKPGETGYKIPRGGMYEYVSAANYFGEIVEWCGYGLASWSWQAAAFAVFTFLLLAPRGLEHHRFYQKKFDNYPKSRRAVIPFIW